jgi:hypothetical protein
VSACVGGVSALELKYSSDINVVSPVSLCVAFQLSRVGRGHRLPMHHTVFSFIF